MSTSISAGIEIQSWYETYGTRLRSAARRIVGNADDAEDALQDAFVAAVRSFERYDGSDPYPWLYRIATRKALNIAASRKPGTGRLETEGSVPSAEDVALGHLSATQLTEMIRREPAVALHVIGNLRFREVGERLGTPIATAATRIRRGKHRLRTRLQATLLALPESKPA